MYFTQIKSSSIVKNLSVLVSGTVLAQLIIIVSQLFLRRVFTPEDFGAFAVYMSVVGIAVSMGSLRYEQTILLPKTHKEGWQLTRLSIYIALFFSLIFAAGLFVMRNRFAAFVGLSDSYVQWLFFLPFSILLFNITLALNYFLMRLKLFRVSGENKVLRRAGEGVFQIAFGIAGKNLGLIIGDVLGQVLVLFRSAYRIRSTNFNKENLPSLKSIALRYKSFPLKNTFPSLLNAFSRLLPVILISRFFTTEIVGYFDLARFMLIIPLSMVSVSLNQVLVQRFSEKRNNNISVKKDALGVFGLLFVASIAFVLFINFLGIPVFELFFGAEWTTSGVYAKILVWAFALKFLISPFNACFIAFEKIGWGSIWQTFYFLLIISLFFVSHTDVISFLKIYMAIELLAFVIAGFINFSILHTYEKKIKNKAIIL